MTDSRGDMSLPMQGPSGTARLVGAAGPDRGARASLSREEFAAQFQGASGGLWCIAVAVLGGRNDAEDVLQDAAAIGFSKLGAFDPATSFAAWMGEIVRNVARNQARKVDRRRTTPTDPASIDAVRQSAAAPGAPVLRSDGTLRDDQGAFDDRVVKALGGLDETARICLLLRTIESMSYREISRVMGIPEGTAMSHVHRSRHTLREMLVSPADGGEARRG